VLVHRGQSANSGHYYSYVRGCDPPQVWFCANDSSVYRCQNGEHMAQTRDAYLLFYVRRHMKDQADLPAQPEAQPAAAASAPAAVAAGRPKRALEGSSGSDGGMRVIGPQLPPHLQQKRQRVQEQEDAADMDTDEQSTAFGPQLPPGWKPATANGACSPEPNSSSKGGPGAGEAVVTPKAAAAACGAAEAGSAAAADDGPALPPAAAAARAAEARMAASAARGQPSASSSKGPWRPFVKPSSRAAASPLGRKEQQSSLLLQQQQPQAHSSVSCSSNGTRLASGSPMLDNSLADLLPDYEDEEDWEPVNPQPQQQEVQPQQPQQQQQQLSTPPAADAGAAAAPAASDPATADINRPGDYDRLKSELEELLSQRLGEVKPVLVRGLQAAHAGGQTLQQVKPRWLEVFRTSAMVGEVWEQFSNRVFKVAQSAMSVCTVFSEPSCS